LLQDYFPAVAIWLKLRFFNCTKVQEFTNNVGSVQTYQRLNHQTTKTQAIKRKSICHTFFVVVENPHPKSVIII
jgi:hypothetical protein